MRILWQTYSGKEKNYNLYLCFKQTTPQFTQIVISYYICMLIYLFVSVSSHIVMLCPFVTVGGAGHDGAGIPLAAGGQN